MNEILPGTRVLVYWPVVDRTRGYITQRRRGTVIARYGKEDRYGRYPDVVDVVLDSGKLSRARFTDHVEVIQDEQ